jgi:thiol-disulfide isomerase/thioredoxin
MASIVNKLYADVVKPYKKQLLIFILIIIFSIAGYYAYKWYVLPIFEEGFDQANANARKGEAQVLFFHADWCPHCKKALPEWKIFSDQYDGTTLNGYQIECKEVDCTKSDDQNIKNMLDKYGLKQYPTIIAMVPSSSGKDKRVDYDAKVKKEYLDKFVTSLTLESNNM